MPPDTTNKGISTSKLMGGSPVLGKESNVGKLANITRRVTIRVGKVEKLSAINAEKITKLKSITKSRKENVDKKIGGSSPGLLKALEGINANVEGMLAILGDRLRFEKKVTGDERKRAEQAKRGASEKKLESNAFKGLQKIGEKVLAPVMSLWDKIVNFISTVFLGKIALKLFDWFTDPENEKKVKAIGRFFKDWWPALLTGFLVFGTGLGAVLATLTTMVVGFSTTMVTTTIPSLIAAAKAMGPWGWAALAVLGTAAVISTQKKKVDKNVDEAVKEKGAVATVEALKQEQKDRDKERNPFQKFLFGTVMGEDAERKKQIKKAEGMNKGGQVPGRGPNKDTVPAMLTPGEFVMSRDAVDKWGADTLANMNAAGGGTNIPTLMGGYNEGGKAIDRSHHGTIGYRFGQINPTHLISSSDVYTNKTIESIKKRGMLDKFLNRDYDTFREKDLSRGLPGVSLQTIEKFREGNLRGESILTEDIASVGLPDVMQHQVDLMRRINAVKGFEDKTIEDVINSTVGMDAQQYTRLLNRSDAARATQKKKKKANKLDKEAGIDRFNRDLSKLNPNFQGGGLVQKFAGGGKVKEATLDDGKTIIDSKTGRTRGKDAPGAGLLGGGSAWNRKSAGIADFLTLGIWDFDKRGNLFGGKHGKSGFGENIGVQQDAARKARLKNPAFKGYIDKDGNLDMDALLGKKSPSSVPGPPNKPTTTVAYDQTMREQAAAGLPQPQMKLPKIEPSAMISVPKVAVLGISV